MYSPNRFKNLLEPGYIGNVRTKNRMVKMGSHPGEFKYEGGNVPQRLIDIYAAFAKGGIGLCTTGCGACDQYNGGLSVTVIVWMTIGLSPV